MLQLRDIPGGSEILRICSRPDGSVATAEQFTACAEEAKSLFDAQRAETMRQLLVQAGTALAIMTVVSIGLG